MADTAEILTFVVILLATLGLLILNRLRTDKKLRAKLAEAVDDVEEMIENATGLDVELNDAVEEILDSVADNAEEVLEDLKEDGDLDTDLEEVVETVKDDIIEDLNENLEATLGGMTVSALKDMLRERGLPVSGKKAELIERLLDE